MQFTDKPIDWFQDDRFGLSSLARSLARAYDGSSVRSDGFIWALNGEWGSGKTSFIELLCLHLTHLEMARLSNTEISLNNSARPVTTDDLERMAVAYKKIAPVVKRYAGEPEHSMWYDPHRIAEFGKLTNTSEELDDADHYWRLMRANGRDGRHIVVKFNPWIFAGRSELASALFSEISRAIGTQLGKDAKKSFGKLVQRLATLSAPTSSVAGLASPLAGAAIKLGLDGFSAYAQSLTEGQTIGELKEEISGSLQSLGNKAVLVILDDLDRLQKDEFIEIVSLLKSLGRLSNISYLLVYDDDVVNQAESTKLLSPDVYAFLEKIVQYKIELPPPDGDDIESLFNALLEQYPIRLDHSQRS